MTPTVKIEQGIRTKDEIKFAVRIIVMKPGQRHVCVVDAGAFNFTIRN